MTTTLSRHHVTAPDTAVLPPAGAVRLSALTTTLRASRNPGDLTRLATHLDRRGLRRPVTTDPAGQVITGARRVLAARLAGLDVIPCRTVTTVQQALDVITAERAADQADPEAAALTEPPTILALLELDAALRTLEWWPRNGESTREDHRTALTRVADNPDGTLFWNTGHYSHGRAVWLAAHGWRSNYGGRPVRVTSGEQQEAAAILSQFGDRDATRVTSLYRAWRTGHPVVPGQDQVMFHHRDVPALLASLQGISQAVTRAGVPAPDLTPDDTAALNAAATDLIRRLTRFRKGIK